MTTQYLDEADQLSGRIAVVDHGRVVSSGTPDELKSTVGSRLDVVVRDGGLLPEAAAVVARVAGTEPQVAAEHRRVSAPIGDGAPALTDLLRELDRAGVAAEDVVLRRPTLDEVFLHITEEVPA